MYIYAIACACLYDTSMLASMIYLWATIRGLSLLVTTSPSFHESNRQGQSFNQLTLMSKELFQSLPGHYANKFSAFEMQQSNFS
jgi:hypothetical protein